MEQFIRDTGLSEDDLHLNYDDVVALYASGKLAMYFGSSSGVKMFQDQGINTTFLPFFQPNGEKWLMTTPYFQVALNRELTQDTERREKSPSRCWTQCSRRIVRAALFLTARIY